MRIKAIIRDRDGVLIDSEGVNIDAATETFKELNIDITDEDKKEIIGRHPRDYIKYFQSKYTFDAEEFHKRVPEKYYKLFDNARIFQPAIDLIHRTKDYLRQALNTGGESEGNKRLFQRVDLEGIFEAITTCEECKKLKPDPEGYLRTLEKLGLPAHKCVVIEDTDRGLLAAKAAGIRCIVITNEYTKGQDFSLADIVVPSASEITREMIESLR